MQKWSLPALADGLLGQALSASSRRGVCTVDGGRPHLLYQAVIALGRGQRLAEHDDPCGASVQVLRGRVRVTAGDDTTDGSPGQLLIVSGTRHSMTALEDAVVLLTVANRPTPMAVDRVDTDLGASYQGRGGRWPVERLLPAMIVHPEQEPDDGTGAGNATGPDRARGVPPPLPCRRNDSSRGRHRRVPHRSNASLVDQESDNDQHRTNELRVED
jgi:quercetin dioxygenase-like cupin family protein